MRSPRTALGPHTILMALVACSSPGCVSPPTNAALVQDAAVGTTWVLDYWDGPTTATVERDDSGEREEYTVEAFGFRREGWGRLMPWSWFAPSRFYVYLVDLEGPRAVGGSILLPRAPVSGFFSHPNLSLLALPNESEVSYHVDIEACRAARDANMAFLRDEEARALGRR